MRPLPGHPEEGHSASCTHLNRGAPSRYLQDPRGLGGSIIVCTLLLIPRRYHGIRDRKQTKIPSKTDVSLDKEALGGVRPGRGAGAGGATGERGRGHPQQEDRWMPQKPTLQVTRGRLYKCKRGQDPDARVAWPFPRIQLRTVATRPSARTPTLRTGTPVREAWL